VLYNYVYIMFFFYTWILLINMTSFFCIFFLSFIIYYIIH